MHCQSHAACGRGDSLLLAAVQPHHANKRGHAAEHSVQHEHPTRDGQKRWRKRHAVVCLQPGHLLPIDQRLRVGFILPPTPDVKPCHGNLNQLWADDGRFAVLGRWVAPSQHRTDEHHDNPGHHARLGVEQVGSEIPETSRCERVPGDEQDAKQEENTDHV